jgi:hypothetical protein
MPATCAAQNIVGKWKGGSTKCFYSAEYAKQTGKPEEEKSPADLGNYEAEFKPDHTIISSFTSLGKPGITTMTGEWSLSGNQLTIITEPKYGTKKISVTSTIAITGNTMVTTSVFPAPASMIKTIATLVRM